MFFLHPGGYVNLVAFRDETGAVNGRLKIGAAFSLDFRGISLLAVDDIAVRIPEEDADYVFIEKIAFGDPFKVTRLDDKEDLIDLFSERADYTTEDGEPTPVVYENDSMIGELKR